MDKNQQIERISFLVNSLTQNMSGNISLDELKALLLPKLSRNALSFAEESVIINEMSRSHAFFLDKAGTMIWTLHGTPLATNDMPIGHTDTLDDDVELTVKGTPMIKGYIGAVVLVMIALTATYLATMKPNSPLNRSSLYGADVAR